ncbi:MAG: TolC family protein [Elusimicrobia bacterium]|nr:TolC family protein [Elusimicrobiota bacterium]
MRPRSLLRAAACLLLPAALWAAPPAAMPPLDLSLQECVALAVQNNLSVRLAKAGTAAARGRVLQSSAALLPRLTGSMSEVRTYKENLAAMGFSGGGFPELIGPFNTFDARIRAVAEVFDLPSILRLKSSGADDRAAALEERLAVEQVAAAAALAYVELFRARQAIASAEADVGLSLSLRQLAEDKKHAGTAAGIDVARAKTREAEEKLALLEARNVAQEAEVRLLRVVCLPLDRSVVLKDAPSFAPSEPLQTEAALQAARADRWELRIAEERFSSARSQWRAEQSQRLPSVVLTGDVGLSGPDPDYRARTTGSAGAALQLPIFAGGAITGRVREADSRKAAAEARLDSLRAQVDEDVRLAIIDLGAAVERVDTASEVARLAEDELAMARDRFAAGVADNVELLNSQTALTHARDVRVSSLARYQAARISLALALGRMKDFAF